MALTTKQQRQIDYYNQQFQADGTAHYLFACHAAFPVVFSVEMLHQLWVNFKVVGEASIPKVVISDFLLSNLCQEVGLGLYEFRDEGIRTALLHDLEQQFDKLYRNRLAAFLYQYAQNNYNTPEYQNLKDTHQWTALATLNPQEAIQKIGDAISKSVVENDAAETMRIHSLLEEIVEQQPVLEDLLEVSKDTINEINGNLDYIPQLSDIIDEDNLFEIKVRKDKLYKYDPNYRLANARILDAIADGTTDLDLSDLNLTMLPKAIKVATHLVSLNLNGNKFKNLRDLSYLQNLQVLRLQTNEIIDINFLENLSSLMVLDLSSNQVTDIRSLEKLTNLTSLYLSSNQVTDIRSLEKLTNTTTLDLSSNQVTDIRSLEKLTNLTSLYLNSNQVTDIRSLEKLTNTITLDLSSNQVTDIRSLEELTNLTSLYLNSNQVTDIRSLEKLTNTTTLDLSSNQVTDIRSLEKLTNLTSLYLNNNQITDIQSCRELINLKVCNACNNEIIDLFHLFSIVKNGINVKWENENITNGFYIKNNPIENPPVEIIRQGNDAIIQYFEELMRQGTVELNEAKMIIVGDGGAGKTSFVRKFISENFPLPKEEETTHGINIQDYYFETPNNKEFKINIWDFGGQEIYHATQQLFLTKRALYVLIDNTRNQSTDFNYWLQTIELFGGESPIVILQNEMGDKSKSLDLKVIQAKFPNVKGVYTTNLLTNRNLSHVKTALEFYIQQLPHIGTKLPKQWTSIRNEIDNLKINGINYISRNKYFEICQKSDIDEDTALILSQYLHDLGVFLHFQNNDILCKIILLDNEWVTNAVYKVLDNEIVKKANGKFTKSDLYVIWGNKNEKEKYRNMSLELLALMKEFNLCYELESEKHTYLAPQLFAQTQPNYSWNETDNLIIKLKYGFMPKGLISRFTVRMHRYINDLEIAWNNGVILETNNTKAEVVSLYAQQEIRIRVQGSETKRFLDIILEEFDKIHSLFEGIQVDRFIPCNCSSCKNKNSKGKHYFKYEVLKRAYSNGVFEVQCQESFQLISVNQLINGTLIAKKIEEFQRERTINIQNHSGSGDNVGGNKNIVVGNIKTSNMNILKRERIDKKELRELLIDGYTNEVIDILLSKTSDNKLEQDIILINTRWRRIRRDNQRGLVSYEDLRVEKFQIIESLLLLIDEW
jgi:Leucine-rich repeat (LRR) protein/GTPase SAR1 family protein